jgi:hypothetical protein
MANSVIFLGWNRAVVGREQQALNLWQKCMEFYTSLQADGRIESFEPIILSHHGGDLNGFILLKGEAQKLVEVRRDDTFVDFTIEAGYCLEGFGLVMGWVGEGLADIFGRWTNLIQS